MNYKRFCYLSSGNKKLQSHSIFCSHKQGQNYVVASKDPIQTCMIQNYFQNDQDILDQKNNILKNSQLFYFDKVFTDAKYIQTISKEVVNDLMTDQNPSVILIGPRKCGKSQFLFGRKINGLIIQSAQDMLNLMEMKNKKQDAFMSIYIQGSSGLIDLLSYPKIDIQSCFTQQQCNKAIGELTKQNFTSMHEFNNILRHQDKIMSKVRKQFPTQSWNLIITFYLFDSNNPQNSQQINFVKIHPFNILDFKAIKELNLDQNDQQKFYDYALTNGERSISLLLKDSINSLCKVKFISLIPQQEIHKSQAMEFLNLNNDYIEQLKISEINQNSRKPSNHLSEQKKSSHHRTQSDQIKPSIKKYDQRSEYKNDQQNINIQEDLEYTDTFDKNSQYERNDRNIQQNDRYNYYDRNEKQSQQDRNERYSQQDSQYDRNESLSNLRLTARTFSQKQQMNVQLDIEKLAQEVFNISDNNDNLDNQQMLKWIQQKELQINSLNLSHQNEISILRLNEIQQFLQELKNKYIMEEAQKNQFKKIQKKTDDQMTTQLSQQMAIVQQKNMDNQEMVYQEMKLLYEQEKTQRNDIERQLTRQNYELRDDLNHKNQQILQLQLELDQKNVEVKSLNEKLKLQSEENETLKEKQQKYNKKYLKQKEIIKEQLEKQEQIQQKSQEYKQSLIKIKQIQDQDKAQLQDQQKVIIQGQQIINDLEKQLNINEQDQVKLKEINSKLNQRIEFLQSEQLKNFDNLDKNLHQFEQKNQKLKQNNKKEKEKVEQLQQYVKELLANQDKLIQQGENQKRQNDDLVHLNQKMEQRIEMFSQHVSFEKII